MPLTLMYITNRPEVVCIAQRAGVDRIWIDMEYIGKEQRQSGMNTVKSHHTIEDIRHIRPLLTTSQLLVRVNPIHDTTDEYPGSEGEIEAAIQSGAEVIMLPMFKQCEEVERFIRCVRGRAKTLLLFETAEAVKNIDSILNISGIDEVHIGLNDLHLAYGKRFMFELLADGTVERLCSRFSQKNIPYGFGGIARIGYGMLPAEYIIADHYAFGSSAAILSRGFCDANRIEDPQTVERLFIDGVKNIREREKEVAQYTAQQFVENHAEIVKRVKEIVAKNA